MYLAGYKCLLITELSRREKISIFFFEVLLGLVLQDLVSGKQTCLLAFFSCELWIEQVVWLLSTLVENIMKDSSFWRVAVLASQFLQQSCTYPSHVVNLWGAWTELFSSGPWIFISPVLVCQKSLVSLILLLMFTLASKKTSLTVCLQAFNFPFLILLCRTVFSQASHCSSGMASTATCFKGQHDLKCSFQTISAFAADCAVFITGLHQWWRKFIYECSWQHIVCDSSLTD